MYIKRSVLIALAVVLVLLVGAWGVVSGRIVVFHYSNQLDEMCSTFRDLRGVGQGVEINCDKSGSFTRLRVTKVIWKQEQKEPGMTKGWWEEEGFIFLPSGKLLYKSSNATIAK